MELIKNHQRPLNLLVSGKGAYTRKVRTMTNVMTEYFVTGRNMTQKGLCTVLVLLAVSIISAPPAFAEDQTASKPADSASSDKSEEAREAPAAVPASRPASDSASDASQKPSAPTDISALMKMARGRPAMGGSGKVPGMGGSGSMVFTNAPINVVLQFLSKYKQKPIIPRGPDVLTKKITIVSQTPLSQDEMAEVVVKALLQNGVYLDERETIITAMTVEEARRSGVLTQDIDLMDFLPGSPEEIINGKFQLKHTLPSVVKTAIKDILPENAVIVANDAGRVLFITDTRAALERYSSVIKGLDVPDVARTEMRIFRLKHAKAEEVVQIMNQVLLDQAAPRRGRSRRRPTTTTKKLIIVAEPTYNWIVAIGDKDGVESVAKLTEELDKERPRDLIPQVIKIRYADVNDLSQNLTSLLRERMRSKSVTDRLSIVPYKPASMILVYGSEESRKLVDDLVKQMDISETEERIIKTYDLLYADPVEVAEQITTLFEDSGGSSPWWWGRGRSAKDKDVSATADTRLNKIIVKASPNMHELVAKLIEELDTQSSAKDLVPPKVFLLRYANAVEVAALFDDIFEEETASGRSGSFWSSFYGQNQRKKKKKQATRLAGEVKFAADEYSNALIVITDNVQNFAIIKGLIDDLDKPVGVLPNVSVVALEHSDAEDIAQKLNYLFADGGVKQPSSSQAKSTQSSNTNTQTSGRIFSREQQSTKETKEQVYPWLGGSKRLKKGETPVSTLIGRVRIVPDKRTNSLIITVDEDHRDAVVQVVRALDQPGNQVLIEAIIIEVKLDDTENIGIQFSADLNAFLQGDVTDQAVRGNALLRTGHEAATNTTFISSSSVIGLIQFLQRKGNTTIRSRPHIFVADNEEAEVFVGQEFPFIQSTETTNVGISQSIEYDAVGIRLTVTPRIATSGEVDMKVDMEISSIVPGQLIAGAVLVDSRRVSNQVTIKSGETMIIGGLMREENLDIVRKFPLLGDIPLLGFLFRKTDKSKVTTEMIAFITPHVLSTPAERMASIKKQKEKTLEEGDVIYTEVHKPASKPSSYNRGEK